MGHSSLVSSWCHNCIQLVIKPRPMPRLGEVSTRGIQVIQMMPWLRQVLRDRPWLGCEWVHSRRSSLDQWLTKDGCKIFLWRVCQFEELVRELEPKVNATLVVIREPHDFVASRR